MAFDHADVVVIGAGAVGCASAYHLAERADRVVVFEGDRAGTGASFGNAGHLTPSDVVPLAAPGVVGQAVRWALRPDSPFSMAWKPTPSYLSWLVQFARWSRRSIGTRVEALKGLAELSLDLVNAMPEAARASFGYRQAGVLNVYQTEAGLSAGVSHAEVLRHHGVSVEMLGASDVRAQAGFEGEAVGGALFPDDAQCDPYAFVCHLRAACADRGVEFREGVRVSALDVLPSGGFTLHTSRGTFAARALVLAAGTGIPALARSLEVKVPIVAGGGYSVDVALSPAPRLPLLFHERRIAVSSIAGRTRFAGLMEIGKTERSVDRRKARYLMRAARELAPGATTFDPGPVWCGLRPCTPDGVPIVGGVPGHQGLVLAGGHAMMGMTLATGTGRLVADLVTGAPPPVSPAPYALNRF